MKYSTTLFIALLLCVFLSNGYSQGSTVISVEKFDVGTSIENRQLMGADSVFASDVGKLYCYSKLSSSSDTTAISHVWFYNEKQMAKIDLTMKAKTWRTWSSKNVVSDWVGVWRVEVLDETGKVIEKKSFKVK